MTQTKTLGTLVSMGILTTLLGGCGFTPVYKTETNTPSIQSEMSKIYINSIPEKQGVILYNELVDRINKTDNSTNPEYRLIKLKDGSIGLLDDNPPKPEYRLISSVTSNSFTTAIKNTNESARGVVRVQGTFELVMPDSSKIFYASNECGYTVVKNPYASDLAEQNAIERCLQDIGQDAYRQLSLYFRDKINKTQNDNP